MGEAPVPAVRRRPRPAVDRVGPLPDPGAGLPRPGARHPPAASRGARAGRRCPCVFVLLAKGLQPPFKQINLFLYNNVPGFWLFREPMSKLGQLLVIFFGMLFAILLESVWERWQENPTTRNRVVKVAAWSRLRRRSCCSPTRCGPAASSPTSAPTSPAPTCASRSTGGTWPTRSMRTTRPGKVLVLPLDDYYQMPTTWGFAGVDSIPNLLIQRPVVQPKPDGYFGEVPGFGADVRAVETALLSGRPRSGAATARGATGISQVVVRHDLVRGMPGRTFADDRVLDAALRRRPGMTRVVEGDLDLWHLGDGIAADRARLRRGPRRTRTSRPPAPRRSARCRRTSPSPRARPTRASRILAPIPATRSVDRRRRALAGARGRRTGDADHDRAADRRHLHRGSAGPIRPGPRAVGARPWTAPPRWCCATHRPSSSTARPCRQPPRPGGAAPHGRRHRRDGRHPHRVARRVAAATRCPARRRPTPAALPARRVGHAHHRVGAQRPARPTRRAQRRLRLQQLRAAARPASWACGSTRVGTGEARGAAPVGATTTRRARGSPCRMPRPDAPTGCGWSMRTVEGKRPEVCLWQIGTDGCDLVPRAPIDEDWISFDEIVTVDEVATGLQVVLYANVGVRHELRPSPSTATCPSPPRPRPRDDRLPAGGAGARRSMLDPGEHDADRSSAASPARPSRASARSRTASTPGR